jgi:acyl-CoA thioesterase
MGAFLDDVVVRRIGPGRYESTLDDTWNVVRFPQGGLVAAIGLRAAQAEIDDATHLLRTCTTVFASPVVPGRVDITVEVLRRGRSASQVSVTCRSVGADEGAIIVAVFGTPRRGPSFVDVLPPDVPDPDHSISYRDPPPPGVPALQFAPFWSQVEGRAALGHAPWQRFEPTSSEVATWLRFDRPPRLADGRLDPLGLVALADRMPNAIGERTAFAGPRWFAPSADLTVHLLAPLQSEWVLAHDRARWAHDGWASLETTMWDEQRRLVAYATQMVIFTYLE